MPEQLSAHGVSWKVYTSPPPAGSGGSVDQRILENGLADNVLPYFKSFETNPKLAARGIKPTYPHDFHDDIAHNRLPSVSWVLPPLRQSEHPGQSSAKAGEFAARQVLAALTAKHKVWSKTALFITWDENGGFFDHVPPPTAPAGTPGEYVTIPNLPSEAQGIRGPIGLGFRVPMIIASPFSRGGFVSSQVFDHTSTLRFLETRFRVRVPNLSKWRRSVTGDLTGAFNFARPDERVPRLPRVSLSPQQQVSAGCGSGLTPGTPPYPAPPNSMPVQRRVRPRRPSGLR
jgi:phospholipase C